VQVGSNYFLDSNSTGLGPELKYNGSPVVTGEFTAAGGGTWTLIGAEQTASGYEVAWKVAGVDQYTVWNVDSNGNYISNSILPTTGTSLAIESVETSFHQDLNGDGVIGVPAVTNPISSAVATQGAAVMAVNKDTFVFGPSAGASFAPTAERADTTGHDGFLLATGSQPAAFSHDAAPFQWASDGHDTGINHDGAPAMNLHWIDPHAGGFIIG
jgi:hypothetical protein